MILQDIIHIIESVAPLSYQEDWDNSGLQVGDRNAKVNAALLTIDVTESVVNEAIDKGCDLIVSHHPLLFRGLKQLTGATPQERCAEAAIRHGIAIYSAHTTIDSWLHGVSGRMAAKIGVTDCRILQPSEAEAGVGLGVIGSLAEAIELEALIERIAQVFGIARGGIRYVEGGKRQVQRVALCGGAGADLLDVAIKEGADVYVSADFKYHEMQSAYQRISVIDMDHWVSEQFTREIFAELLSGHVKTYVAESDRSPVKCW